MKLSCDKQQLQDALALAVRAVSSRTTMPILECVLLTATQGLTLCTSNLDITITTSPIEADIKETGTIALDAKLFTEIIRKMPGQVISIETTQNNTVVVKSGRSRLTISGLNSDEFPVLEESDIEPQAVSFKINAQLLRDMIRQTIFSVSTDQSKMILTGELMEVNEGRLRMVTVDMFRISYKDCEIISKCNNSKAVVPARAIGEVARMLPTQEDEVVEVRFTSKRAIFSCSTFTFNANLLEGEFIRYDQIFNEDFTTMVTTNRADLLNSIERAVLVATENKMLPIKLDILDAEIIISSRSERGETEDFVPCRTDGTPITIFFNPRYFIDVLRAVDDEEIILKFNTQLSPCTIRGTVQSESEFKYLIVPLRPS